MKVNLPETAFVLPHYHVPLCSDAKALSGAHFGKGLGSIVMEDVQCRGTEVGLYSCRHRIASQSCSHNNDAAVQCSGMDIFTSYEITSNIIVSCTFIIYLSSLFPPNPYA